MPTAAINGTEIYYETYGSGFPLVFAHGGFGGLGTGAGGNVPAWVERFSQHFQVILPDRRSSGRSGFPDVPHTMSLFASDIRELLRHLGHERAFVWGTSAGGPITITFGLEHPDAAAGLVVAETAPWLSQDPELLGKLRERIDILNANGVDAAYEARREGGTVGLNLFAAARPAESEEEQRQRDERRAAIQAQLAKIPREERIYKYGAELRTYAAHLDFNATARFKELKMPVLIVYGTGDTVYPNVPWTELAEGMPNVEVALFEGQEHGAASNTPEGEARILEFLRSHTPS
ncbi:MAG: alpha/beta hydrolase [Dehalococcoidia bacterium]|nr:alpha/beta hydrolase [Dehalococcoidia bacterium]MCB9491702.1 alpha/beta hydrolase [Dehalococcoidia bacterium]